MSRSDDDRFGIRPGTPKQRDDAFINKVMRQTNKAGAKFGKAVGKVGQRPGSRLGRGHVAARFARASLTPSARRVTIKARLVNLAKAGPRSTVAHLRYIEREGVDRQGRPGHAPGLGGGGSLEHRQPTHARRPARQGRHRQRPRYLPRLHRLWDAPPSRRTCNRMAWSAHRVGDPADYATRSRP